jgi:hypothetical protein
MIHLLTAVAAVAVVAALAGVVYRVAGRVTAWRLPRSALAGLAAGAALTAWAGIVRHAALAKNAAAPLSGGRKLSPGLVLGWGFAGTALVVTAAVFTVTAVLDARRARRSMQPASLPAGRRGRRAAVRGW